MLGTSALRTIARGPDIKNRRVALGHSCTSRAVLLRPCCAPHLPALAAFGSRAEVRKVQNMRPEGRTSALRTRRSFVPQPSTKKGAQASKQMRRPLGRCRQPLCIYRERWEGTYGYGRGPLASFRTSTLSPRFVPQPSLRTSALHKEGRTQRRRSFALLWEKQLQNRIFPKEQRRDG